MSYMRLTMQGPAFGTTDADFPADMLLVVVSRRM